MKSSIEYEQGVSLEVRIAEDMKGKYDLEAVYAIDLAGNIVRFNSICENLFGYLSNELRGKSLEYIVKSTSIDKVFSYYEKARDGGYQNFDCQMIHRNGQIVDVNITNIPIVLDGGIAGVYGVVKDITEIKLKRQKLRESEALYQLLTENSLDLIVKTNVEGVLRYVSPYSMEILGYTPEELMWKSINEYIHGDDLSAVLKQRELIVNQHKYGSDSFRMKHKDGHYIWVESLCKSIVDENGCVTKLISVIRDISERKKAEEDLLQREETYREIVEHSPDAIIIAAQEKILFANDTVIDLIGASDKSQLIGIDPISFVDKDYLEMINQRITEVEKGNAVDFTDIKLVRFDGVKIEVEVKAIPTIFHSLPARHIIIRDITERKKTQELLINSEKLSVAGQLAAGIAHEVRNPLTAIKGFLQLMNANAEYQKSYFEILDSEINRIELILNELLMLSKPQDMKFKGTNIILILQHVKTLIDTHATMNNVQIDLSYQPAFQSLKLMGDENQLKQVFINFLKNAIEAMPNGGTITIKVELEQPNMIKIKIQDQGKGIPKEHLERIGQPFFTTKENGTGLGLMISMNIIENHQGSIVIDSDKNGTIIEVSLPSFRAL
jgi:two-component system, sporulation sensor kinase A